MGRLNIESEIGTLRRVVLHTPGPEIEAMRPREAERDLYNDIIPLQSVRQEYDRLKAFLDTVCRTHELVDLLAQALGDTGNRFEFLSDLARACPIRSRTEDLMAMSARTLADAVIGGIPLFPGSLAERLDQEGFAARPLPNAYFMRDSAAVIGDGAVSCAMAFDVRHVESIITKFILTHHPDFLADTLIFDGPAERNRYVTVEGGDILVLSPDVIAVGVSQRTTAAAAERIARNATRATGRALTVFVVELPHERATIHLDMVFTMIDRDAALVFAPLVTGPGRCRVVRMDVGEDGGVRFADEDSLLSGLAARGLDLAPVFCGDRHPLFQEREQWLSGANSFAVAPGKILVYSCNARTLDALSREGFEVVPADSFISGKASVAAFRRLAVTFDGIELARGGGGARCMTLPVERESF